MVFVEEFGDLFEVDLEKYHLAHCISSDAALGAGIAAEFNKRYDMRRKLLMRSEEERMYPTCIKEGKVFNLITKEKYWHKPTLQSLSKALKCMKDQVIAEDVKHIAMPRIGSGIDKLNWFRVRELIKIHFEDTDVEILVRYI